MKSPLKYEENFLNELNRNDHQQLIYDNDLNPKQILSLVIKRNLFIH